MALWLEIAFAVAGIVLSLIGIFLGGKALINVKTNNKIKNNKGINIQDNSTINGITGDALVKIVHELSQNDIDKIVEEFLSRIEDVETELDLRARIFLDKPQNPKKGDFILEITEDTNQKKKE